MKLAKRVIRKITRWFGYDIVSCPPEASCSSPSTFAIRRNRWLEDLGISLLLDVGANVGQYAQEVRKHGYRNRIVSFEPLPAAYAKLQRSAHGEPQWQCLNLALGDSDETREINIAGNSGESSSLLPMRERHVDALPSSAYIGKEMIRLVRLDSLRSQLTSLDDVIWLKIDVQGFEQKVLEGAAHVIEQVKAIEMELSLVPLYEDAPLLCHAIAYLEKKGFQLIGVEDAFRDSRRGHTLQLNGVFERVSPGLVAV
jgi:FkbM family methyltransferase